MANYKPLIGIVTVLYNSENVLEGFFKSLSLQTYSNYILYVIDNASPDSSLRTSRNYAEQYAVKTEFIANKDNLGVAAANNQGIKSALAKGCDFVLLANNDIEMEPTAIERLLDGLMRNNATMSVPKIMNWFTGNIWAAGGKFLLLRASTRHFGTEQPDNGQFDKDCSVEYAPTCFMLIEGGVFERVGLMDENYFVYYDDTDFDWRAVVVGNEKLYYIHDSTISHKESTSTGGSVSDFTLRYQSRNAIVFIRKNFNSFQKIMVIPYFILRYLFKYIPQLNSRQRRIVRNAYREGWKVFDDNYKG